MRSPSPRPKSREQRATGGGKVVDLMSLLQRSLEQTRQQRRRATAPRAPASANTAPRAAAAPTRARRAAPDAWPTRDIARDRASARLKRYAQKRDFKKTAEPSHKSGAKRRSRQASNSSSWCRSTPRAGCTGTSGSNGRARCAAGRCPRARRSIRPTSGSRSKSKITPSRTPSSEGDIPKGQYGGGHVDIWDEGTLGAGQRFRASGFGKGHLEFLLHRQEAERQLAPGAHAHAGQTDRSGCS